MSGRLATITCRKHRAVARVAFVALCALACGLMAGLGTLAGRAHAQPKQPTNPDDLNKVDHKNPVPADRPGRHSPAKFAVPGLDRIMFAKIEDYEIVEDGDE